MSYGWLGSGQKALEFPPGDSVAVSRAGRARVRYNEATQQLERSINGGAYAPFGGSGSGYALAWGASLNTANFFAQTNGVANETEVAAQGITTNTVVPAAGTASVFTWNTQGGVGTDIGVYLNGVLAQTVGLTAAAGVAALSITVAAGDTLAISYITGPLPRSSQFVILVT